MSNKPLPTPLYSCQNASCAEEVSYAAAQLIWWNGRYRDADGKFCNDGAAGWWCEICLDENPGRGSISRQDLGPSLEEELRSRGWERATLTRSDGTAAPGRP